MSREITIDIAYSEVEITKAVRELDAIYDWLADSPTGNFEDLHGLNIAGEILSKIEWQLGEEE